jgi:hypothetical protein
MQGDHVKNIQSMNLDADEIDQTMNYWFFKFLDSQGILK